MVGTTHGAPGSGRPRLVLSARSRELLPADSRTQWELDLPCDRPAVIGSGPDSDWVLPGLRDVHAVVVRDELDEFVVLDRSDGETAVDGRAADRVAMHTGDVLSLGDFEFVYQRDEASDHGRPFAGREGGEGSDQRPQPPESSMRRHPGLASARGRSTRRAGGFPLRRPSTGTQSERPVRTRGKRPEPGSASAARVVLGGTTMEHRS